MWAGADVCGLWAVNVGSLANNPDLRLPLLVRNLGWKSHCLRAKARMFAVCYT
jgi:hypothetical protein